jgi:hypothetical protein
MGKFLPNTNYGVLSLFMGFLGIILYMSQKLLNWYGVTDLDKAMFSILVIFILLLTIGLALAGNVQKGSSKLQATPSGLVVSTLVIGFAGIILYLMVASGMAIQMSIEAGGTYAELQNGLVFNLKMLMHEADPNVISEFATGVQAIVRTIFIIVPALIVGWGALSVLTADSLDEAEGGILALVSAILVWIMLFIFNLIGIPMF